MICVMDMGGVSVLDGCVIRLVYRGYIFASIMRKNQDYILRLFMSKHTRNEMADQIMQDKRFLINEVVYGTQ